MPALVRRCIASFERHLPDYQLVLWGNEQCESIISQYPFARQAFDAGIYAFASDVVRLHILKDQGGIYLDSDLELFGTLTPFLKHSFFSGFQDPSNVATAIMGSEKNGEIVSTLLEQYATRHFLNTKGDPDLTTITRHLTSLLVRKGLCLEDRDQVFSDNVGIYRREVFCPYHPRHGGTQTQNTVSIHHYNGSWTKHRKSLKQRQRKGRQTRRMAFLLISLVALLAIAWLLMGTSGN
ncbi:glycosyltransferase [Isoalcanivorax pacificus W11-5]|uniref:Glycosyltransferase n=2 Tax=Isoalcanivorax TaxID=3020833 RepID=A0A0B4XKF3_9GAMM|nr:glycosyltransferase [Isoalcanivorax pacificus W11-5]